MMISNQLNNEEYNPYYKSYINSATDADIVKGLHQNLMKNVEFYLSIAAEKYNYAYAEGKWTVKDVVLHIIDTERIFAYRVLRISRNDKTPLAGFDQNDYAANVNTQKIAFDRLVNEYKAVRQATIALFESFDDDQMKRIGEASGFPISVRALGYIITGHENHHNAIIKERYL